MSVIEQNLFEKNKAYAGSFDKSGLALPPAKAYLIITCMDARIDPAAAFGIDLGDAHVIRNAGAIAQDALRSVVISQQLLGTREILLVKHTDCGMLTFANSDIRAVVEKNLGASAGEKAREIDFLPFSELASAVKSDVALLKEHPLVFSETNVTGWIYDVRTGQTEKVV